MKKIGMIVAVEMDALHKRYGAADETVEKAGFQILIYHKPTFDLFVLESKAGEIAATAATQLLISAYEVDLIVNFGVVGGLTDAISKHRICVVEDVVHYDFDTSAVDNCEVGRYLDQPSVYIPTTKTLVDFVTQQFPNVVPVRCASGDKFIAEAQQKAAMHEKFQADICEMEAAGIVITCQRNHIPCLLIKMVADGIEGGAEEFWQEKERSSMVCLETLDAVLESYTLQ